MRCSWFCEPFSSSGKEIQYGETHLIVGKGFVVSIRHGASASYTTVRQRCERNPQLLRLGESAIMYAILDFVGDNFFPIIDRITEELEAIEGEIFSAIPASKKGSSASIACAQGFSK